jgi:hypothetical protein
MHNHHPTGSRGKRLLAAALIAATLTITGAITAAADHEPAQPQAAPYWAFNYNSGDY